jgi:hypothetical protein
MKKILLTSALALIVGTGMARAEMTAQQIVDLHPGAQSIRIERGVARTKVYVTINGQVTEVIYDNATDQEIRRSAASPDAGAGGHDNEGDNDSDGADDNDNDSNESHGSGHSDSGRGGHDNDNDGNDHDGNDNDNDD